LYNNNNEFLYLVWNISLSSSITYGGVLYVGRGFNLIVMNMNFSHIIAKSGAAFYLCGLNALINSSHFNFLSSFGGSGGAIYFGENCGFSFNGMCICFFDTVIK
jgi:hypothetical protein